MTDGAVLDITSSPDDQPSLYVHSSGGYGGEGGGTLSKAGTLSPGGVDELFTTTISGGALDQGEDGILLIDLELNTGTDDEEADLIVASSVTDLSGTLEINATGDTNVSDGDSGSVYFLVADDLSAEDLSVEDGAIVQYDIAVVSGDITTGATPIATQTRSG